MNKDSMKNSHSTKQTLPGFSVCMITRNEAERIGQCLDALKALECEIIVLDTGSTDNTARIAQDKGASVFPFAWINDFSAARNEAASHASHDLILAVDADEILTEYDIGAFTRAVFQNPSAVGMILRISPTLRGESLQTFHERVGRFYDRTRFHYKGSIHENLTPLTQGDAVRYYDLPLTFHHSGYEDRETIRTKALRDLELLEKELQAEGESPYLFYQIGKCYTALQEQDKAAAYYEKGLFLQPDKKNVYVREMTESYGYALLETGQQEKALQFLLSVQETYAYHADFCFLLGLVHMNCAQFEQAVDSFLKATECRSFSVEGCNSYRAFYNIGVIMEVLGDTNTAVEWYQQCGPFAPAAARLRSLTGSPS